MGILDLLMGGHHRGSGDRHGGDGHHGHHGNDRHHGDHHEGGHYRERPSHSDGDCGDRPHQGGSLGGIGCPNCKASNTIRSRFCQQCGNSLAPANCPHCAAVMQAGSKFCGQCGKASG